MTFDWHRIVEILGVITGLLSVYFAVKEDNRTWSIGILNAALFGVMFFVDRYYVNVGLQALYVAYNVYSWRMWLYGGPQNEPPAVSRTPRAAWPALLLATAGFTALFGWVFDTYTDGSLPYWDALTTALSLVAQYALTRKWLENWGIWITANAIYIGLGVAGGNYWFAALQLAYIALSAAGYGRWRAELKAAAATAPEAA
ncbi:MAG: nicotinamide mononucleotide transporter [Anaerolineales bacterium]|nr:nicotinamide mononucleotide transporter [Anaerolineales bacterium]